jgi:hypothetical protein
MTATELWPNAWLPAESEGVADRFGFDVQGHDMRAMAIGILDQARRTVLHGKQPGDLHLLARCFQGFPEIGFGDTFARLRAPA